MRFNVEGVWRGAEACAARGAAQLAVDEIGCCLGAVRGGGEGQRGGVSGKTRWRDAV